METPQSNGTQLLVVAREKAELLLKGMLKDQASLPQDDAGRAHYATAIDAARSTLDNLNRALQGAPTSSSSD